MLNRKEWYSVNKSKLGNLPSQVIYQYDEETHEWIELQFVDSSVEFAYLASHR